MPYASPKKQREYMLALTRRNRAQAVEYLGGKCSCGTLVDLEIDHIENRIGKRKISGLLAGSWERLRIELDFCQLLCYECHKIKSVKERGLRVATHGTKTMYNKGCRCDFCSEANKESCRRYRENKMSSFGIEIELGGIEADWNGCTDCRLHKKRVSHVWGRKVGKVQENGLLILGEAPGRNENESGQAFVGRSGELLDQMLAEAGITGAYITNTVACWPPGNRNPEQDELDSCWGRLQRVITTLAPRVIMTVGAVPSKHLLDVKYPIGHLMNEVFVWRLGENYFQSHVVPIFHPAYVLKNRGEKSRVIDRMRLAKKLMEVEQ